MQPSAQLGSHSGVDLDQSGSWVDIHYISLIFHSNVQNHRWLMTIIYVYIYICCLNGVMLPKMAGIIICINPFWEFPFARQLWQRLLIDSRLRYSTGPWSPQKFGQMTSTDVLRWCSKSRFGFKKPTLIFWIMIKPTGSSSPKKKVLRESSIPIVSFQSPDVIKISACPPKIPSQQQRSNKPRSMGLMAIYNPKTSTHESYLSTKTHSYSLIELRHPLPSPNVQVTWQWNMPCL